MKLDISELMKIKGRLVAMQEELNKNIINTNNTLNDLIYKAIQSAKLSSSIRGFSSNLMSVQTKLNNTLVTTIEFFDNQIKLYLETNENVKADVDGLITLINSIFDSNGNVVSTYNDAVSATQTGFSASNEPAVNNTIGDQTAYDNGVNDYNYLIQHKMSDDVEGKTQTLEDIYYYFKGKGDLSDEQIAGIIGNIVQESALDIDRRGGGLFQMQGSRTPADYGLQTQLDNAYSQMKSYPGFYEALQGKTTVAEATSYFCSDFEAPGDPQTDLRIQFANGAYFYIKNNLSK